MEEDLKRDDVVESLGDAVLSYAAKGGVADTSWVEDAFMRDSGAWSSPEELKKDASEIVAMTDAFDRERETFDAARAEGRSSANYLMERISNASAENGANDSSQTAQEIYSSVMQGGRQLLGELGFVTEADQEEKTLPGWTDENKGDMAKEMVGVLSARGVASLGDLSESLVAAADQRIARGDDGNPDITDYIEKQSKERSCKGLAVPVSAAIVRCARKGLLGESLKKVPADAITTATCVATEGVKTLVRVGKGELTLDEGREKIAETVCVAAGAYVGKKAGEKVGRNLGRLVGGIFGPVGAEVCGRIGSKVGSFVGHKVGKVVGKVVYKVGQVYRKAKNWLKEKVGGTIRSVGKTLGRVVRCFKFW